MRIFIQLMRWRRQGKNNKEWKRRLKNNRENRERNMIGRKGKI